MIKKDYFPAAMEVRYSWRGLAPYSLRETYRLDYRPKEKRYRVTGQVLRIPGDGSKKPDAQTLTTTLSKEIVADLLAALKTESWEKSDKMVESILSDSQEYPNIVVEFSSGPKNLRYKLISTSNTPTGAPWNLNIDGHLYKTDGKTIVPAVTCVMRRLRPDPS